MGKKVFVDLDGIVADFVGGVFKLHGLDPESPSLLFKGSYDIARVLGMSIEDFWGHLDSDETFWASLEKTSDADEIMNLVEQRAQSTGDIYFLSSPARNPRCHYGKAQWVSKHYPKYINRLILTGHKHFLAGRDRVLIDDSDENCKKFSAERGKSLLYPRPWNSKHLFSSQALSFFEKEFRRFI